MGLNVKKLTSFACSNFLRSPCPQKKPTVTPPVLGFTFILQCAKQSIFVDKHVVITIFCYLSRDSLKFQLSELIVYACTRYCHMSYTTNTTTRLRAQQVSQLLQVPGTSIQFVCLIIFCVTCARCAAVIVTDRVSDHVV